MSPKKLHATGFFRASLKDFALAIQAVAKAIQLILSLQRAAEKLLKDRLQALAGNLFAIRLLEPSRKSHLCLHLTLCHFYTNIVRCWARQAGRGQWRPRRAYQNLMNPVETFTSPKTEKVYQKPSAGF